MGIKIRKFNRNRRLNEDDTNQQQAQSQTQDNNQQPVQNQQPAQPQQPQQQSVQQSAQQQPAQQQDNNQQQLPQNVSNFLNRLAENIRNNNIYWALAMNIPEELQKEVPEFKQGNQAAADGIKAWDDFKKNPSKETYDTFINKVGDFALSKQPQQAQQPAPETKPAQPVQNNNQNQPSANAQSTQEANMLQDSKIAEFGGKLHERLVESLKMDYYAQQIAMGIRD